MNQHENIASLTAAVANALRALDLPQDTALAQARALVVAAEREGVDPAVRQRIGAVVVAMTLAQMMADG